MQSDVVCKYCNKKMEPMVENIYYCPPCGHCDHEPYTKEDIKQLVKDVKKVIE